MSGRRRQTLSPTLFPFLAVLVCTLGTLILLLALVAQNTSDTAQQIADAQVDEVARDPGQLTVGDVELLVEEEQFRLTELVSFREAQTGDLENRRNQLAHVEDHMRRIRERLQQISVAMEQAASDDPQPTASDDELNSLKNQLVEAETVVKKLREEIKTAKPRFVIVPHQGPNGTDRRPIYLECTAKGVTIWPEGVRLTRWQLEQSSPNANPLDDALRAARYYAMQEYGDTIPPYPMLLVRPDGVDSYYAARSAMLDWDDQFGYELVPTDVTLAYPNPDPVMRQRMEYAINQAANRLTQESIARSFGGRGSRYPGGPSGSGTPGGTNVPTSVGRENGVGFDGSDRAAQVGSAQVGSAQVGSAQVGAGQYGAGQGGSAGNQMAGASRSVAPKKLPRLSVSQMDQEGRRSGYRDHRMFPTPVYASGGGQSTITAEDAKRRLERQMADSASSFDNIDPQRGLDQAALTAIEEIAGDSQSRGASSSHGSSDQAKPSDRDSMWLNSASGTSRDGTSDDSQLAMLAEGNADAGGRQRAKSSTESSSKSNPGGFGPPGGAMTSANQQNRQRISQRMVAQQPSPTNAQNASAMPQSAQQPSNQNPQRRPESLLQRSGVDWALPSSISLGQGNEIVRSIRIQVHSDRLVVLPSAGARISESFPIAERGVNMATLQMATSVHNRIERWGAAAPGTRWSPRLVVDVMPGAERRFTELEKLMTGSGLTIQRSNLQQAASQPAGQPASGPPMETNQRGDLR